MSKPTSPANAAELIRIQPDNPYIGYSGYVRRKFVPSPIDPSAKLVRFDRILAIPEKGYQCDNPGTRIRFRTDATNIQALFYCNDLHVSESARNSMGIYAIDGVFPPDGFFQTQQTEIKRQPEFLTVSLPDNPKSGFRDYELVLPYADSVDFVGLDINPEARFEAKAAVPKIRYVAYGDSVTQGFSASDVGKTFPFLLGSKKGWETINLGLGGRASHGSDGKVVASLKPDVVTVLMGGNDWQGGVPPDRYRSNMEEFFANVRAETPTIPIYVITPLWVDASWKPAAQVADLDIYRKALREIAAAKSDLNLHVIDGPELIDLEKIYFDQIPVHPNDTGFEMMVGRLVTQIDNPGGKP